MLTTTLALCALAMWGAAKAIRAVMDRLGLDVMTVLLWLGLAERPSDPQPPRARALARASVDGSTRRRVRSPHRRLARSTGRRRSVVPRPDH